MDVRKDRSRREFIRDMATLTGAVAMPSAMAGHAAEATSPDLVVASGEDPKAMVRKAVAELGGMRKFVSRGDVVVIKPNIGWDRKPEQGANTNPDVVVTLIEMAFEAGAKEIKIFDRPVDNPAKSYAASGIAAAAQEAGAKVLPHNQLQTTTIPIKDGVHLKQSSVFKDALECNCYINVPVAKHHMMTELTMALKNHMGVTSDNRALAWHTQLHQALADFASAFKPKLTVLDAYRIVVRNGPKAGGLADVQMPKKCIVGTNQVSVDAYGTTLFGKKPTDIGHIAIAGKMGLGEIDLGKLTIKQVTA
ncbi:DUF362 domain-containing protein [Candidatus Sumerlaeota bacterium]|nr:DUF362 domain-containing protein [Candidatus Sumerlaeota bacterium]